MQLSSVLPIIFSLIIPRTTVYIYTPNGSQVLARYTEYVPETVIGGLNYEYKSRYPQANIIGDIFGENL